MSPQAGRLTSFRDLSSCLQLNAPHTGKLSVVLLPLHIRKFQSSLHRHARRSMQAQTASAQPEEFQLLVSSSNGGNLTALRSLLSQEDVTLASDATVVPCFEVNSMHPNPHFDAAAFMERLGTVQLGHMLLSAAQLPSTQTLLQSNARRFPDGTVCVADVQSGGKGRGGNVWTSPPGCLMFSALMRLKIPDKLLGDPGQKLDVRIKWPNDLYAGRRKLGGILCQSVYRDRQFQVVIGIGLNVSNEQPSTCVNALLREAQRQHSPELNGSPAVSPEALLAAILTLLERHVHTLQREGFQPIEAAYLDNWLHTGQQVTWKGEAGEQDVSMCIRGLTPDGYLLAMDASGEQYSLSPDGNSLDFFQGLIKTKLRR